jgi:hypothetical protein
MNQFEELLLKILASVYSGSTLCGDTLVLHNIMQQA